MGKSMIIIDTPATCIGCPCVFTWDDGSLYCGVLHKPIAADDVLEVKPDWCPARELPECFELDEEIFEEEP